MRGDNINDHMQWIMNWSVVTMGQCRVVWSWFCFILCVTQTVSPLGGQRIIHQAISYRNACNWGGGGQAGGRGRSTDGRWLATETLNKKRPFSHMLDVIFFSTLVYLDILSPDSSYDSISLISQLVFELYLRAFCWDHFHLRYKIGYLLD